MSSITAQQTVKAILDDYSKMLGDLTHPNTDKLATDLCTLIQACDTIYFSPLTEHDKAQADIPHEAIALINRITAELTGRYLCSGF